MKLMEELCEKLETQKKEMCEELEMEMMEM